MKSDRAKHNLFAVSASSAEGDINVERDTDTTLLLELGDIPNIEPRRENNTDECNGREEADVIYDLGGLASVNCNFNKAQCQHFAFVLAYALGSISSVAAGTGYEHTIIPIDGDLSTTRSNPSFTGVFRYGDSVLKRRFASMFIESFTATFTEDDWVKLTASVKGTGKVTKNVFEEIISAPKNSTELTLAVNGVHGSTDEERLDNIHSVLAETETDVWEGVDVTAVSDATPGVLTITAPG
ncbi:MAG: hypothetical protein GY696_05990, partial [Gammaproteobacteria bacterium]|nr:hypothetical protein [Gammaproteobacteria bacterium]